MTCNQTRVVLTDTSEEVKVIEISLSNLCHVANLELPHPTNKLSLMTVVEELLAHIQTDHADIARRLGVNIWDIEVLVVELNNIISRYAAVDIEVIK